MSNILDSIAKHQKMLQNLSIPSERVPVPVTPRDYKMADRQYEIIMETIAEFESNLDGSHEIAVKLTSFGQTIVLSVTSVGYSNPSILYFHGFVNEEPATLVQHVSQLNFLLLAVRKDDESRPPRRIGFATSETETEHEE